MRSEANLDGAVTVSTLSGVRIQRCLFGIDVSAKLSVLSVRLRQMICIFSISLVCSVCCVPLRSLDCACALYTSWSCCKCAVCVFIYSVAFCVSTAVFAPRLPFASPSCVVAFLLSASYILPKLSRSLITSETANFFYYFDALSSCFSPLLLTLQHPAQLFSLLTNLFSISLHFTHLTLTANKQSPIEDSVVNFPDRFFRTPFSAF